MRENTSFERFVISVPLGIVVCMFAVAFMTTNWYESAMVEQNKKAISVLHHKLIERSINETIQNISAYDGFLFASDAQTDIVASGFIDYAKMFISPNVKITLLCENGKIFKNIYSTDKMVVKKYGYLSEILGITKEQEKRLLSSHSLDLCKKVKNNTVQALIYRYYPKKKVIIGVNETRSNFENTYENYARAISQNLSEKRHIILVIEFFISLLCAILVSYFIKLSFAKVKNAGMKLEKTNEALKVSNRSLEDQLFTDTTTGLPNLVKLKLDLEELMMPKLILIEVDMFDKVREYYDSKTIKWLIMRIKGELDKFCEKNSEFGMKLYKTNDCQFALLENAPIDVERYEELATILSSKLNGDNVKYENQTVGYSCSIGFSLEDEQLYKTASIALREAKDKERDYVCYLKVLDEDDEFKSQLESSSVIREALKKDNVMPYFQPIFDRKGNVIKYECLVRILGENNEIVAPRIFLDVSKKIKKYADIEKMLIKKSIEAIKGTDKHISINLSSRDMLDGNVSNYVIEQITKHDVAKQVIFEILEDESIDYIDRVTHFIKRVKFMGVRIAIDDFGSGYSNFSYMLNLKPDYVKIDGTLIRNIDTDERSQATVSAILHFTKRLNIPTIAEFVHSKEVYEKCLEMGVDEFQGYYLGEPGPSLVE